VAFLTYWWVDKVQKWREKWVNARFIKYLLVGGSDIFFAILPYISYVVVLVVTKHA
jgi:hypothetical protein